MPTLREGMPPEPRNPEVSLLWSHQPPLVRRPCLQTADGARPVRGRGFLYNVRVRISSPSGADVHMPETLTGQIDHVTFHNPQSGFAVLRVQVKGCREPVTVVGNVPSATPGEHLEATGQWITDRNHGRQFKARELKTLHPASAEGILRYLESGAVRSVGPHLAAKIVGIYKERTLEILDHYPDLLLHIRGIGAKRLARIKKSWQEQQEVHQIMLFLVGHGIGSARAVQIYRTYGQDAIPAIKGNPYRLADEIRGIGFKTADELAGKLGVQRNSPLRARAAVRYTLGKMSERADNRLGRDRPKGGRRGRGA
jgi:exodeoxyribonuclease V alpha subunit